METEPGKETEPDKDTQSGMDFECGIDVVDLTRALVRIPSVNPMGLPPDSSDIYFEHRLTDHLTEWLVSRGIRVFRQTAIPADTASGTPPRENLLAYLPGHPRGRRLMLEVHQDTVPVAGMTIAPWAADIRDGRIYGRGACDIKGGMAAVLSAFWYCCQLPVNSRPNLILAFTINEEHGFSGATALQQLWTTQECDFLGGPPDAVIVTEPTELNVVVSHKGVIRWRCRTRGRAAHSSQPWLGRNAIYGMARVLSRLEYYATHVVGDLAQHAMVGCPTLSVGTIRGGLSVNTVPDTCEIHIERRLCPGESPEAARQHVIDDLSHTDLGGVELVHDPPDIVSPGLDCGANRELADSFVPPAVAVDIRPRCWAWTTEPTRRS